MREFSTLKSLSKEELKNISDHKDVLNGVYCIKDGVCKLTRLSSNGKEQIVRFVKGGDMLGYRSILSEEPVSLTVTVMKDMKACYIPKKEIFDSIKENPDMMKIVCHDLRDANTTITNMAQKSVKERLADTLLFLKETFGINDEGFLAIVLTREELSSVIGTATESAIRLLSEFKRKGIIGLEGKKVRILDEAELLKISQGF